MNDLTMGQRIAEERKKLGLSQEALGERMGVSRQAISKWEADGAVPEIDKLIALSRLFGVSVGWLLGVEEKVPEQPDTLSEAQMKMVEELVKRYQPAPQPQMQEPPAKKPNRKWLLIGAAVILALILAVKFLPKDYSDEYRQLKDSYNTLLSDYSSVRAQLATLNQRLDDITQVAEGREKLLTNHSFSLTSIGKKAIITFHGMAKTYHESETAAISVIRSGSLVESYECYWDGIGWTAELMLDIADGYEYSFDITDLEGNKQIQLLDGKFFSDIQTNMQVTCSVEGDFSPQYNDRETLSFGNHSATADMPRLYLQGEVPKWEDIAFILYVDGTEVDRDSLLRDTTHPADPESFYSNGYSTRTTGRTFYIPKLEEGAQVRLAFRAELTDWHFQETTAGNWVYRDGALVEVPSET